MAPPTNGAPPQGSMPANPTMGQPPGAVNPGAPMAGLPQQTMQNQNVPPQPMGKHTMIMASMEKRRQMLAQGPVQQPPQQQQQAAANGGEDVSALEYLLKWKEYHNELKNHDWNAARQSAVVGMQGQGQGQVQTGGGGASMQPMQPQNNPMPEMGMDAGQGFGGDEMGAPPPAYNGGGQSMQGGQNMQGGMSAGQGRAAQPQGQSQMGYGQPPMQNQGFQRAPYMEAGNQRRGPPAKHGNNCVIA